jgi:hypothetical protein
MPANAAEVLTPPALSLLAQSNQARTDARTRWRLP